MAPVCKITYFNGPALAEPARFLLKYGGIEFDDDRFEVEQWSELKPSMLFGQVPVLTANGKQYHQSIAITRFCARLAKLVGKDEWEDLEIDAIVDTVNDLRTKIALYSYEKDVALKESRKGPLMEETLPYYLTRLDKIAKDNGGYLACKKLTWADMYFVALLDYFNYMVGMDITSKYSNLDALKKNVLTIPAIKHYVETRPKPRI